MAFSLLPAEPGARAEAEEYLRAASGIAFWILLAAAVLMSVLIYVFYIAPENRGGLPVSVFLFIPVLGVTGLGYVNARLRYPVVSSSLQMLAMTLVAVLTITVRLQLAGSTSLPAAAWYVLVIVLVTVYFSASAGAVTVVMITVIYGGVVWLEQFGYVPYSPMLPAKSVIQTIPGNALGTVIEVTLVNVATFVITVYIARALRRRRRAVEEANQELTDLHETKDRFLSVVSHDLRTPITSIRAYAELAEEETTGEPRRFMQIITREADRLNRLVTDLLDLDKMGAGKMEWNLTRQDIAPVLENAVHVFRAAANDQQIQLETDIAADLPPVNIDADRISQLIANLLSNAIKFTPEGGTVTLRAARNADSALVLSVTDTGPGIAEDDIATLFDRFSQTETGKKTKGGTGLGLAIAKEIATAHSGDIAVASEPGTGATFSVSLPVEPAQ